MAGRQQSLYASQEGALYQSYDAYAGAQGFYEPGAQDGYGDQNQQQQQQQPVQDTFAQYYQQQQLVVRQAPAAPQHDYFQAPAQTLVAVPQPQTVQSATIMVPIQSGMQIVQPQVVHQVQPMAQPIQQIQQMQPVQQPMMASYVPVQYGPELRGVGIKFGERIDPRTGGLLVYVKRLVQGGPAAASGRVNPGDTLVLINGEDVYGYGLEGLRERIPGPAGTIVRLGFRTQAGQLYEVNLPRTAYGSGDEPQQGQPQQQQMPQQQQQQQMMQPQSGFMQTAAYPPNSFAQPPQQQQVFMGTQQVVKQVVTAPQSHFSQPMVQVVQPHAVQQQVQRVVQYVQPQQQIQYVQSVPQQGYFSTTTAPVQQQVMSFGGGTVQYIQAPQVHSNKTMQFAQSQPQVVVQPQQYFQSQRFQQEPAVNYQDFMQPQQVQYMPQQQQPQQQSPPPYYGQQQVQQQQLQSLGGGYQQQAQQQQQQYGGYQDYQQPAAAGGYQDYGYQQGQNDWYGQEHPEVNGTQV